MIVAHGTGELILDPDEIAADVLDGILALVMLCSDPEARNPFPPSSGPLEPVLQLFVP